MQKITLFLHSAASGNIKHFALGVTTHVTLSHCRADWLIQLESRWTEHEGFALDGP